MSMRIRYVTSCDCGGVMSATELDLRQDPDDLITINLDLFGDMVIECNECADRAFVPAITDYIADVEP